MSLHYSITIAKDHATVTANWEITLDVADDELISSFVLAVEGKPLNTQCSSGNKACNGADIVSLANPSADCPVSFAIITNKADQREGSDTLRGEKTYDDAAFYG